MPQLEQKCAQLQSSEMYNYIKTLGLGTWMKYKTATHAGPVCFPVSNWASIDNSSYGVDENLHL